MEQKEGIFTDQRSQKEEENSKQIIFYPFKPKKIKSKKQLNNLLMTCLDEKEKEDEKGKEEMEETKIDKKNKKRVVTEKWNLPIEYLNFEKQWELIQTIDTLFNIKKIQKEVKKEDVNPMSFEMKTLIREIERKIYGYKQQDIEKNRYDSALFLSIYDILEKIIKEKMKCFYCWEPMYVLYEIVRESKQWSVDRINNYQGHNKENFVLACLECNLKRRRRTSEKFLFTKQLSIIKKDT